MCTVVGPHRAALRDLRGRGVGSGELSGHEVTLDLAVDICFGTTWYRLISHHAPVEPRSPDS